MTVPRMSRASRRCSPSIYSSESATRSARLRIALSSRRDLVEIHVLKMQDVVHDRPATWDAITSGPDRSIETGFLLVSETETTAHFVFQSQALAWLDEQAAQPPTNVSAWYAYSDVNYDDAGSDRAKPMYCTFRGVSAKLTESYKFIQSSIGSNFSQSSCLASSMIPADLSDARKCSHWTHLSPSRKRSLEKLLSRRERGKS